MGNLGMSFQGILSFFSQGWIGSLAGFLGITIGLVGLLLYRSSRIGPRPVYQRSSRKLIGREDQILPEEVKVLFKEKEVPRLTRVYLVFWNSGTATLHGKDIVETDPLRVELEDGEILRASLSKCTREANQFIVTIDQARRNIAYINFDFLDPGDGTLIEILHTDERSYPDVSGTIRGVQKGVLDRGSIKTLSFLSPRYKFPAIVMLAIMWAALLFGVGISLYGLFGATFDIEIMARPPEEVTEYPKWGLVALGTLYGGFPAVLLWLVRRRHPKALFIEELGE